MREDQASEMARRVKHLLLKPHALSLIPGTKDGRREQAPGHRLLMSCGVCAAARMHILHQRKTERQERRGEEGGEKRSKGEKEGGKERRGEERVNLSVREGEERVNLCPLDRERVAGILCRDTSE